jgi:amidohydrolase
MNNLEILEKAKAVYVKIIEYRRHFHQHPELSFQEYETSAYISKILRHHNIVHKKIAETGIVALIGKGERCVALRADIDALPILEETGLQFASLNTGVMHACGHDMHIAMLLGTAIILKENESKINGIVKLIFQPGEEKIPGGASILINEGVLNNPKPQVIFGQHINPGDISGVISTNSGPILASADEIYITIKGKGSHAAQPHLANDPIITSAQLILYFQTVMTKFRNPINPGVLSITSIHGGIAPNIFPDDVKLMGTLRTFSNKLQKTLHEIIEQKSLEIAGLYNCKCDVEILKGYPTLVNNNNIAELVEKNAVELFGSEKFLKLEPKMWAEDFAYYGQQIPACFWFLGVKTNESADMPPLHNAKLNPSEEAMINGVAMFIKSVFEFLK